MTAQTFPGCFASLADIAEHVRSACQQAGLDAFATYQVETAVDEACSNIIDYAYGGENRGNITLECTTTDEGIRITLSDTGKPFNPQKIPKPNIHAPLDKRQAHGLGLYIIHQWMDDVHFEFTDSGNTLTMFKRREKCA